jgi:hypothetical protein
MNPCSISHGGWCPHWRRCATTDGGGARAQLHTAAAALTCRASGRLASRQQHWSATTSHNPLIFARKIYSYNVARPRPPLSSGAESRFV